MNLSARLFARIIGLLSAAIHWLPVVTSFVSITPATLSIRTDRAIFITLEAHPVTSVLPKTRRSKRNATQQHQLPRLGHKQNATQPQNRWGNFSIPDGLPQLTEILRGITKDHFEVHQPSYNEKSSTTNEDESKLLRSNNQQTNGGRHQSNNDRNHVRAERAAEKGSNKAHKIYNPKKMEHCARNPANEDRKNDRKPAHVNGVPTQQHYLNTRNPVHDEVAATSPWQASFRISKQTQDKIQQAGRANGEKSVQRATSVLKALLNTPSHKCNEANVVCALTLSAKICEPDRRPNDDFRSLLIQTLDVLHHLVKEQRLSPRQLCNSVWAIAKHYDRDQTLMPPPPQVAALSSDDRIGIAESWSLLDENDHDTLALKRIDETVDEIARQLTTILVEETDTKPSSQRSKVGELCMASWAYGILRPRRRPPGWQSPPQMGRLNGVTNGKQAMSSSSRPSSFLTFEKWSSSEEEEDEGQKNTGVESLDVTDRLFDAIGESLCSEMVSSQVSNGTLSSDEVVDNHMRLELCSWSELANVAWAYASHGHCRSQAAERLLISLSNEAVRRFNHQEGSDSEANSSFLTRDISQIVWALGTLQCDNFRLADGLVDLVDSLVAFYDIHEVDQSDFVTATNPFKSWSCPDLVQLIISLAHARIDHLPLLRALFGEAHYRLQRGLDVESNLRHQEQRLGAFRAWEISVLLWAQARLYLTAAQGQVFEDFAAQVPHALVKASKSHNGDLGLIGIGPQEQANVAWSLTVLQQHQSSDAVGVLSTIFREAARFSQAQRMIQLEHAHQLWQALFLLEEESPMAVQDVPPWFRQYLRQKWLVEKSREKRSSARHRSLSQTLHFMGVAHLNEHDEDIDVAIVLKPDASWTYQAATLATTVGSGSRRFGGFRDATPVKVAVEFDGPNHFAREKARPSKGEWGGLSSKPPPPRALGHTVLKYRLLKKQGWTVVRVPYYEFDKIPFWASMERQRYLQRLLKTHANIRFSEVDVSQYKAMVPSRESRFD